jgi:hypothetical protein
LAANPPRLDKIRAAVMAEMAAPPKPKARFHHARYSVVALLLMIAVLLPWSIRNRSFTLPPTPPEALTPQGTEVVFAALPTETATLTATLQANYAPNPSASILANDSPMPGATETP